MTVSENRVLPLFTIDLIHLTGNYSLVPNSDQIRDVGRHGQRLEGVDLSLRGRGA